jgi:hypothetical protein
MDLYFWIKEESKLPLFFVIFALSIVVSFALGRMGASLKTEESPKAIVSLELANAEKAKKIVDSWQGEARENAFLNLGLDYLFLFLYPFAISLACYLLARSFENGWIRNLGLWLSVASLLMIILDAVENYAIIQMLKTRVFEPWADVSRFCAIPKFLIAAIGLLYVILTFAARCIGWLTSRT